MVRFAKAGLAALAILTASTAGAAQSPFDRVVPLVRPGDPMPATIFTDQDGRHVSFADLKGSVSVVAFVYTRCTDACPIVTRKFAQAAAQLGDARYRMVEITIDPKHDTPGALKKYALAHSIAAPSWLLLTGAPADLSDFELRLGVQAIDSGHGEFIHNDRTVIVAPNGAVADIIDGPSWSPADVAAEMKHAAGIDASWIDRADLALGTAAAFCGSAIAGRSGLGDLVVSFAVFGAGIWLFAWVARRLSAPQG